MGLLRRGFHTLIKNVSFSSRTDMGSHDNLEKLKDGEISVRI